jgi:methylthioribulose-1-phosphate dehydratase
MSNSDFVGVEPVDPARLQGSHNADALCKSDDPLHPANLIPELCRQFYTSGWVTGTGGGISIKKE